MKNAARIAYAALAYLIGLGGLTYYVAYLGGWDFLPRSIQSDAPGSVGLALLVDIGLVLLFGLQHSVMARKSFKDTWTRIVPPELERATYVLVSGVFMLLFSFAWQPLPGVLWDVRGSTVGWGLVAMYGLGFLVMVSASFIINHFELFGLQQVYDKVRGREPQPIAFTEAFYYTVVRHPIQVGILMCLWFTPFMSATHLLMAGTMTVYIFIGLYFEERDLLRAHGRAYESYRHRVNKLLPVPKVGRAADVGTPTTSAITPMPGSNA